MIFAWQLTDAILTQSLYCIIDHFDDIVQKRRKTHFISITFNFAIYFYWYTNYTSSFIYWKDTDIFYSNMLLLPAVLAMDCSFVNCE